MFKYSACIDRTICLFATIMITKKKKKTSWVGGKLIRISDESLSTCRIVMIVHFIKVFYKEADGRTDDDDCPYNFPPLFLVVDTIIH